MKNKYIKEMNSIHASESFKEEMIDKMIAQKNQTNIFSFTATKVAVAFACVCLCVITTLSIKNYYDVQNLKEQVFATKKTVDRILYLTNDWNHLMDRNYDKDENQIDPTYYNPTNLGGMGSVGDIFPGTSAKSDKELVKEEDISLSELKQLTKVPVIQVKESVMNHKDKIALMNQLVDLYGQNGYTYKTDNGLLQFITDQFYISIFDKYIELTIEKDKYVYKSEEEAIETTNQIIQDFKLFFPSEYSVSLEIFDEMGNYEMKVTDVQSNQYEGWKNENSNLFLTLNSNKKITILLNNKETKLEYYPIISYSEALEKINKNECYAFGGVKEYLNYDRIAYVKLQYFFEPQSESFLPYYEIYYEVDYDLCAQANYLVNDGLKHYGSVYVPAISNEYIEAKYDDGAVDVGMIYEDYVNPNFEAVANGNAWGQ